MAKNEKAFGRRQFLGNSAKLAIGAFALNAAGCAANTAEKNVAANTSSDRKMKLALVGTGSRGLRTWGKPVIEKYGDIIEMAGLCDINPKRVEFAKRYMKTDALTYKARDFGRMLEETKPDTVIVTTTDCFHVLYAVQAMEFGCDVISEKPLGTDARQCQQLLDAERRTGRKLTTTFNARYMNHSEEIKKVLMSGDLGRIISAEYQEYLDTSHGASYFRRWHGKIRFSGSLLVHKASHHFDQMNWWLDAEPVEVNAYGKVDFYGKNNSFRYKNCRGCPFKDKCDFYWDITKDKFKMDCYVACEDADGYLRDGCVWDNDIDTYDSMTVEVKYNNGVLLSYSLNAFLPYEGQKIAFNGEKGRLDARIYHRQPWDVPQEADMRLTRSFADTKTWQVQKGGGGHGGADDKMKDMMFRPGRPDPLDQLAGSRAGIISSLIGIAARKSIETGQRVKIADLVRFPSAWKW